MRGYAQSRAEQSRAEQSSAEQGRAGQSRAEQSRAEQSRAEEPSAGPPAEPSGGVQAYGVTQVFVSSDDPSVLAALAAPERAALPSGRAVRWVVPAPADRAFLQSDTNYDVAMRLGVMDRRLAAESAVLDTCPPPTHTARHLRPRCVVSPLCLRASAPLRG